MLKNVQNAIDHLLLIINKHQIEDCRPQVETLKQLRESLDNDEIQDVRKKVEYPSIIVSATWGIVRPSLLA